MIIGLTGTLGAGKDTMVDYLRRLNFKHYSVRDFLIEEIKKRGMLVNRDSMRNLANQLRAENSPSYIVEQLYERAQRTGGDCIIESIRVPGEIIALRKKGEFYLIAIDADRKLRYERIRKRGGEKDNITFEKFVDDEEKEMKSDDPNKQNLSKCIEMADYKIDNSGTLEEFYQKIDELIARIKK